MLDWHSANMAPSPANIQACPAPVSWPHSRPELVAGVSNQNPGVSNQSPGVEQLEKFQLELLEIQWLEQLAMIEYQQVEREPFVHV